MGPTSALAFGYNAAMCGVLQPHPGLGLLRHRHHPALTDLHIRPAMMLGAATLDAAQALIARGLAADGSAPYRHRLGGAQRRHRPQRALFSTT